LGKGLVMGKARSQVIFSRQPHVFNRTALVYERLMQIFPDLDGVITPR
jgi:hypothetical protein